MEFSKEQDTEKHTPNWRKVGFFFWVSMGEKQICKSKKPFLQHLQDRKLKALNLTG